MVPRAIITSFFAVFLVSRDSLAIEAWGSFQLTQNSNTLFSRICTRKIVINKNVFFMYFYVLAQRIKYFVIESLQNKFFLRSSYFVTKTIV